MQKDNLHNFVQVSTTLALLVGVALVVYELRQTRDLASSNFQSETLIARIAGFQAVGGESFADAIANVCTSTDSLSAKDLVVLDAYFDQHYFSAGRLNHLEQSGNFGIPLESLLPLYYRKITDIPMGWDWLQVKLETVPITDPRHKFITQVLEEGKAEKCRIPLLEFASDI